MTESRTLQWIIAFLLAMALIALIGYARGEPGDDGRVPEAENSSALVLVVGKG